MPIHPSMKALYPPDWDRNLPTHPLPARPGPLRMVRGCTRPAASRDRQPGHPRHRAPRPQPGQQFREQPGRALPEVPQHLRRRQTPRQPQASRSRRSRAAAAVRVERRAGLGHIAGIAQLTHRGRARGLSRSAACTAPDEDARDLEIVRRFFRAFRLPPGSPRQRGAAVPNCKVLWYLKLRNSRLKRLSAVRRIRGSAAMKPIA